jgi:murein L,D-transpeptidase YcbB/YkuD
VLNFLKSFSIGLLLFIFSCKQTDQNRSTQRSNDYDLELSGNMKNVLDTLDLIAYFPDTARQEFLQNEFLAFYRDRGYKLAWNQDHKPGSAGEKLLHLLEGAWKEGLQAEDYDVYSIRENFEMVAQQEDPDILELNLVLLDLQLTSAYMLYGLHLNQGKISPNLIDSSWFLEPQNPKMAAQLEENIGQPDLGIKAFYPKHREYRQLTDKLVKLHELKNSGSWNQITLNEKIEMGDSSRNIAAIKERLQILGDLDQSSTIDAIYDQQLQDALELFQFRHDLSEDGQLGPNTLEALNVAPEEKIERLKVNLERLRWQQPYEDRYLIVNIPDFRLNLYEAGGRVMTMKTIVGKSDNATPVFSELMEYIVFSPRWTVPHSIATEEMLPRIKEDTSYLSSNNYLLYDGWGKDAPLVNPSEVDWENIEKENFPFKIVQESGKYNALGTMKFMMPNSLSIYLHDTPGDHLFANSVRGFSHGCIRLEEPVALAEYLLKGKPAWDERKIRASMNLEEPLEVTLPQPIPVHLVYRTVFVDEQDRLNFRDDIYNFDQIQLKFLEAQENVL